MKSIMMICVLFATVICHGFEIYNPNKYEVELLSVKILDNVDEHMVVLKTSSPLNYLFAFIFSQKSTAYPIVMIYENNINVDMKEFYYLIKGGYCHETNSLVGTVRCALPSTRNDNLLQEYESSGILVGFNDEVSVAAFLNTPSKYTYNFFGDIARGETIKISDKTIDYRKDNAKEGSKKTIFQRNESNKKSFVDEFEFEIPDSIVAEIKKTDEKPVLFPHYEIMENGYKFAFPDDIMYYIVQEERIHIVATHKNVPFAQYQFQDDNLLSLFKNEFGSTVSFIEIKADAAKAYTRFYWPNGDDIHILFADQWEAEDLFEVHSSGGLQEMSKKQDVTNNDK